ncbi:MAG: MmgE/PrpD family protein [Acidimicrobiia bacterium]|nr:MmgE/PrpD family protein [Acidimicrobiia bacterium]
MNSTLTSRFIESVVAGYRAEDLNEKASLALFDFITCASAGLAQVSEWFDHSVGPALVIGSPAGASAEQVAAVNAAAAQVLDRDDLHWPSLTHPGSIAWPVALAVGGEVNAPFSVVSRAAAIGYEVTARLASALGPSLRSHWHPTTTAGTVGGAVAAASVLAPDDPDVAISAAGHAISVSPAMIQVIVEHSPSNVFDRAHAARTGVAAGRAARGGLVGMKHGLEDARGLVSAVAPEANPEDLLTVPGEWALTNLSLRPYAATGYAQTAVEAARSFPPIEPGDIQRVEIVAPPGAAGIAGSTTPGNALERWWSIPYAVAVVLASDGPAALEDPSGIDDAAVAQLLSITELEARSGAAAEDLTVDIAITIGGAIVIESAPWHLGHPERPLTDADRIAKWLAMHAETRTGQAEAVLRACRQANASSTRDAAAGINRALQAD